MNKALIFLCCMLLGQQSFTQTYADLKGIFASKCVTCHKANEGAPFSLETYESVKKRISFIQKVVASGYMPPWKPDVHYRDFANNRSLTGEERQKILAWIANQAPEGPRDRAKAGNADLMRQAKNSGDPVGRPPDLVLKIDSPFIVRGDNQERFVTFKVPFNLSAPENIEAVEFYTNNKKIVHHANYGFYEVADKNVDIEAGSSVINPDVDTSLASTSQYDRFKKSMTYYTGWIPGTSYEYYPKNFGWVLPKRGVLLFTAHYTAIAADESSVIGVKLYFKKQPVERAVRAISLGSGGIAEENIFPPLLILPNRVSKFTLKVMTPEAQSILYVWPHMHYIGKEFYAYAVTPANDTIHLVHIPDWDFRWQELYRMKKLVHIPAGSIINMEGTYDNTANNPANPNSPPQFVYSTGDMLSTNEMFTLIMLYVPYKDGDENISLE